MRALPLLLLLGGCQMIPGTAAYVDQEAETAVRDQLADGPAARFRNIHSASAGLVCGEVNAKNGFGAYIGFTPFAYRANKKQALVYPSAMSTLDDAKTVTAFPEACLPKAPVPEPASPEVNADEYNRAALDLTNAAP